MVVRRLDEAEERGGTGGIPSVSVTLRASSSAPDVASARALRTAKRTRVLKALVIMDIWTASSLYHSALLS